MLRLLITIAHRILKDLERIVVTVTARGGTANILLFRFDFLNLNNNFKIISN